MWTTSNWSSMPPGPTQTAIALPAASTATCGSRAPAVERTDGGSCQKPFGADRVAWMTEPLFQTTMTLPAGSIAASGVA